MDGLIQPTPHDPTENAPAEMLSQVYNTDPGVETSMTEFPELPLIRGYLDS